MTYIVQEWALVRRGQMVDLPRTLTIHPDFLMGCDAGEFEQAFREIGQLFYQFYTDMSEIPEQFGLPLYEREQYRYGAKEARESRFAAYHFVQFLLFLFSSGELHGDCFTVDTAAFKAVNRIKKTPLLFHVLQSCGFVCSGLKNDKIPTHTAELNITYPDNACVPAVLSVMAKRSTTVTQGINEEPYHIGFFSWDYKLLESSCTHAEEYGARFLSDKLHSAQDKQFVLQFHQIMEKAGYCFSNNSFFYEGSGIAYYDKPSILRRKGPYMFLLMLWKDELRLFLRIRNGKTCIPYLEKCPESIQEMFRHSDPGCKNHADGICTKGVGYLFEGRERWHCGCCNAPFFLHPRAEDIAHYLKLTALGASR